jgi:hypothetical protein
VVLPGPFSKIAALAGQPAQTNAPFPRLLTPFASTPFNLLLAPIKAAGRKIPMRYSVSHQKLKLILAGHGLKTGDAGGIDALFGGTDGYYWYGTLRDLCPEGKTISWDDQYSMVNAIQAHENATAAEDEMKPQVPSAANIAALSKLLGDPL